MSDPSEEPDRGPAEIRMYPRAFWRNVRIIVPYLGLLSLALILHIWLNSEEPWPHPWLRLIVTLLVVFPLVFLVFDRRNSSLTCPRCQRILDSPGDKGVGRGEYPVYVCPACNVAWKTGESAIRYTGRGWGPRESPNDP